MHLRLNSILPRLLEFRPNTVTQNAWTHHIHEWVQETKPAKKYYKEFNSLQFSYYFILKSTNLNFIIFYVEVFYSNGPYRLIFTEAPVRPCVLISLDILGTSFKFWSHQRPNRFQVLGWRKRRRSSAYCSSPTRSPFGAIIGKSMRLDCAIFVTYLVTVLAHMM